MPGGVQSMTGYSRATRHVAQGTVTVELRSINHRYLDVGARLPDGFSEFEGEVAPLLRTQLKRGRVDVSVSVQLTGGKARLVTLDETLAKAYHAQLVRLKRRFGLKGQVLLEHLLALPQLMTVAENPAQRQAIWAQVKRVLQEALRQLVARRRAEGQRLVKDVRANLQLIRTRARTVRARLPKAASLQRQQLRARLKGLFDGTTASVSSSQLQEVLAMVRETDVNEELVRLDSHLVHARQVLGGAPAAGKTLDFIAQELMRETNTLGAKANDATIARCVIDIKGAIERIREQAQNLE